MAEPELPPPADAREDPADALTDFVDKWRARWPEWAIAEVFVTPAERPLARAWASLQQELTDAAWGGDDPRPGEAKLGWWQEELGGWRAGVRRHPLGSVLQKQPVPWAELAAALPSLAASRTRPFDGAEAFKAVAPFAAAVDAIDTALFAPTGGPGDTGALAAATLLQWRLLLEGDEGVPLGVLAAAEGDAGRRAWADALRERWPAAAGAPRPRRLWAAMARARLAGPDPTRPLPAWRMLLPGWRAARG